MRKMVLFILVFCSLWLSTSFQIQPVRADCTPDGTATNNLIVCTGTDTNGVNGGAGQDTLTVNSGAHVSSNDGNSGAAVINGGTGNDSLVNNGIIEGLVTGSDFPDGMSGGGGADTLINNGTVIVRDLNAVGLNCPSDTPGCRFINTTLGVIWAEVFAIVGSVDHDFIAVSGNVNGNAGTDIVAISGDDTIQLGSGARSESFTNSLGTFAGDNILSIDGGDGIDLIDTSQSNAPIAIDLSGNTATSNPLDTTGSGFLLLFDIENATTGGGNDTIMGNEVANVVNAGGGHDVVDGAGGNDRLFGAAGNDSLAGGSNDDFLEGAVATTPSMGAAATIRWMAGRAMT